MDGDVLNWLSTIAGDLLGDGSNRHAADRHIEARQGRASLCVPGLRRGLDHFSGLEAAPRG
jgi:hypothetical protein